MLLSLVACEHKDLCFHHPHDALVRVDVDWSQFHEETPSGMSVMVYPEDPEMQCRTVLSNEISYATMALPAGRYKTLVYNQSPTEFGSVYFSDMDQFYKAVVRGQQTLLQVVCDTWRGRNCHHATGMDSMRQPDRCGGD